MLTPDERGFVGAQVDELPETVRWGRAGQRIGGRPMTDEEFQQHFGDLPTDDEA